MKKAKQPKEITVNGFVVPEDWDEDDNVVAISVTTDDDDYLVDLNKLGEELFDFLDEDVQVTGLVRVERDGTKRITVTGYEVLETDDEDYETEEGYEEDLFGEDPDLDDDEIR